MAGLGTFDSNGNLISTTQDVNPGPFTFTVDRTNQVPRTDGGAVGSGTSSGSVSNTVSQGAGANTNFSLQNFETLILSDIAKVLSSPLVGWGIVLIIVWFAWKHFHKRR